ncbi:two component transcriptional regulator, LuxR family [Sphingopyxis sp. YR583]|uniref:response regulator transcription factor n=1 Tax=Sphingopyxis sp. YR583 TaxID=1881047 RepID=UPI0008A77EBB|nr:response regulator transcription factor [Sphingopyxis sp. YR583]SEH13310.1 two component transcriptional regulator, LuxR family [Sphingopyxis sp. YR583]
MSEDRPPIRILIVDDHPVLRAGVAAMLGNQSDLLVIGEAGDGAEALEQFRSLYPDVVVMDLQMPGMNGVEATAAIRAEAPSAKILVLTTYAGDAQAVRALRAGATGYLLKNSLRTQIVDAVRAVHAGKRHIDPDVSEQIALHVADEPLTERELSVLELVAQGHANKQAAAALGLAEETVKAHLKNIFVKLDVNDRTRAVTVAMERGMLGT